MNRVFALFGKSCVGKSEIAEKLAQKLNVPVRHCGELVKNRAAQLGISTSKLPDAEHTTIDEETRRLVGDSNAPLVVEGTFLDIVLRGLPNVILVHLTCDKDERARRFTARTPTLGNTLELRDEADNTLRRQFYSNTEELSEGTLHLDTTRLTAEEAASRIIRSSSEI